MGWLDDILERLNNYSKGIETPTEVASPDARKHEVLVPDTDDGDVFDRAVEFVLSEEGGYANDPRDPGGETKYGISKRAYPHLDIKNLTKEQAKQLYYKDYFQPIRPLVKDNPKLAVAVFDAAVNMGVGTAIRLVQKALGVKEDGVIGPVTLRVLHEKREQILPFFLFERLSRYQSLSTWGIYRKGWTLRLFRLAMEVA